jgi:uncharacterized protein
MAWLTRRRVLSLLGVGAVGLVATRLALPRFLRPGPVRPIEALSDGARRLIAECFEGLDPARLWDGHAHMVGLGEGGSGCWVNPSMRSHLHPVDRLRFEIYMAAAGITASATAEEDYLARLLEMQRLANPAGRIVLMAFDWRVGEDGEVVKETSPFHVPNEYVASIAEENPQVEFCASVHPYRRDALGRLDAVKERGAVAVKWLPNAMGIDPASPRCDAFYDRLAELGLVLISHAGLERAVHVAEDQELGNPLRVRRALDRGVRVVLAHCASLGSSRDLDRSDAEAVSGECFDLFLRLMGEKQYEENLFADISALGQVNRCGRPLREMILARELHPRLLNGSDYPLPAIDPLTSLRLLEHREYLEPGHRALLGEIFAANPLLFDFVLKRVVGVTSEGGERRRFLPIVFESARVFV